MSLTLQPLKIARITRETADAVSLTFSVPAQQQELFAFEQGQYITLELTIGGEKVRRAYSMSSAPHENELTVTVKMVKNGKMSSYINTKLTEGSVVDVLPPQGRFTTPLAVSDRRDFYLLGGGSGITPLFSIAKAVLENEPKSVVHLLYGNYDEDSIIFKAQLDALVRRYEGQIVVEHLLSNPKTEKASGGMFSFMKKATTNWTGLTGIPDTKTIEKWLDRNPAATKNSVFFTCGPLPMMQNLEKVVLARGIDKKQFHMEVFSSDGPKENAAAGMGAVVSFTLNGKQGEVSVPAGQTILDVLLKQGHDAPFSCKSGACSTCIAKVTSGSVTMDNCFALDDDEVAKGFILACQAKPASATVSVNFDV
jgi:ring-1,2-phenylacetyl-CoA epoxidase subunit PaaE